MALKAIAPYHYGRRGRVRSGEEGIGEEKEKRSQKLVKDQQTVEK